MKDKMKEKLKEKEKKNEKSLFRPFWVLRCVLELVCSAAFWPRGPRKVKRSEEKRRKEPDIGLM